MSISPTPDRYVAYEGYAGCVLSKNWTKPDKTGHFVLNRSLRMAVKGLKSRRNWAVFSRNGRFFPVFGQKPDNTKCRLRPAITMGGAKGEETSVPSAILGSPGLLLKFVLVLVLVLMLDPILLNL